MPRLLMPRLPVCLRPFLRPTTWRAAALLATCLALSACQGYAPLRDLPATLAAASGGAAEAAVAQADSPLSAAPAALPATSSPAPAGDSRSAPPPVALAIPAIGLQALVTPMGWELILDGEEVTTRWVVPEETLGWAVNSAGAGGAGSVVIAGHQALGAALFRPLALGEVAVGQEIQLQTADGSSYLYQVTQLSDPIPAIGATPEEVAQAEAYLQPTATAQLILITGWPADVTTHRLFVVAAYRGLQQNQ